MRPVIALIGPRGSGKTLLGQELAARLGWRFVDTDRVVEERLGRPIVTVFQAGQEALFRSAEAIATRDALANDRVVVATGGGAVLDAGTRERLRAVTTVFLWAPPELLVERTLGTDRPPLTGLSPLDEAAQVLAERRPLYAGCAALTLDTSVLDPETLCSAIEAAWRATGGPRVTPPEAP